MDRNRDARRSGSLLVSSNGLSRRRHRTGHRDSPDEDGHVELQESVRLRERVKKDRDRERDREREREKERERPSTTIRSSKRKRGEDTSEESVNDEEEDEDADINNNHINRMVIGGGSGVRLLPPNPNSVAAPAVIPVSNNNYHNGNSNNNNTHNHNSNYCNTINNNNTNHQHQNQQIQTRKSFPPSAGKVFRAAPVWKSDEMIGVSVPRKARSASTKRSHDWISNNTVGGVSVAGREQISNSPARPPSTDFPAAPMSPSYSNVSAKKKIKQNGSKQPKPPKSSSKTSSLNPEELEIEIAEVLYGLKTQSQVSLKKEIVFNNDSVEINRSSSDAKSRVSSPVSNSPTANIQSSPVLLNSCSSGGGLFTAVAPKRKKPRHVTENINVRSSPVSMKVETDQTPKRLEKIVENGDCKAESDVLPPPEQNPSEPTRKDLESKQVAEGLGESPDVVSEKESVNSSNKEIPAEAREGREGIREDVGATVTALASVSIVNSISAFTQKEEKFHIDLEASPERGAIEHKQVVSIVDVESKALVVKDKEDEKVLKIADASGEDLKLKVFVEESEVVKKVENKGRNGDMEKQERENVLINKLAPSKSAKEEAKSGQSSLLPMPMSMPSWPPMGYMAPPMQGSTVSSSPVQARPKRCATHCHIARNIQYLQQFMKMNPFWQAAASSNVQDKAPVIHGGNDKASQPNNVVDPGQKKQQILLQQTLPPQVAPSNLLHGGGGGGGGPAFFFHLNQQQAAAAAAAKPATTPTSAIIMASTTAPNAATAGGGGGGGGGGAVSFSYPNMPAAANETQYVAILQNNYPFPIPIPAPAATPPNYRGTHSQPMPMFNGSFYSSQIIHPSQLQQPQHQQPISQSSHQNSPSSSSSQKHRPTGPAIASGNGGGGDLPVLRNNRQMQQSQSRQPNQPENEVVGREDSSSTGDSRGNLTAAAPVNIYGQQFAMPMRSQNYPLMASTTQPAATLPSSGASTTSSGSNNNNNNQNEKKQSQTFDMSFSSSNGGNNASPSPGFDLSSMAQNPAFLQSFREATRHNIQMMTTTNAQISQTQRKNVSKSQLSDSSVSASATLSSSAPDPSWTARTSMPKNTTGPVTISNAQFQQKAQQAMQQLQKHHHQQTQLARAKNNGYPSAEQLSSAMASSAVKFPNYPQNLVQTSNNGNNNQGQSSPQWKNSGRNSTSHQQNRGQQSHTQISFGSSTQKGQPPSLSSSNQSPSSPIMVGSPTTSSMSKGAGGSPRTGHNIISSAQVSSFSPQHTKNSSVQGQKSVNVPSILGNPNVSSTSSTGGGGAKPQLQQQQLQQQQSQLQKNIQQAQIFFSNHQLQSQSTHPGAGTNSNPPPPGGGGGYYIQRWRQDQQQQLGVGTSMASSSTGMLTLCPVSLSGGGGGGTTDPAKAIAAATVAATTMKGGYLQSHGAQFANQQHQLSSAAFTYGHTVPATVQVNKPVEQKQQAGNDNVHACWQTEKK